MGTKQDTQFYRVARTTFANLRREYQAMFPSTTGKQFSALCYEKTSGQPTIMDWLLAASQVVHEAERDAIYYDNLAEEHAARARYDAGLI